MEAVWERLGFYGAAVIALGSALVVVAGRTPVQSSFGLIGAMIGTAAVLWTLGASFLAGAWLLIGGGIAGFLALQAGFWFQRTPPTAPTSVARTVGAAGAIVLLIGSIVVIALSRTPSDGGMPDPSAEAGDVGAVLARHYAPAAIAGGLLLLATIATVLPSLGARPNAADEGAP